MEERSSASEKVPTKEECQPAMLLKKKLEKKRICHQQRVDFHEVQHLTSMWMIWAARAKAFAEDETVVKAIVPWLSNLTTASDEDEEKLWATIAAHTGIPDCRAQLENLHWAEFYCFRLIMEKWSATEGFKFPPSLAEWEKLHDKYPPEPERRSMEKFVAPMLIIKQARTLYPDTEYVLEEQQLTTPKQKIKRKRQAKGSTQKKAKDSTRRDEDDAGDEALSEEDSEDEEKEHKEEKEEGRAGRSNK